MDDAISRKSLFQTQLSLRLSSWHQQHSYEAEWPKSSMPSCSCSWALERSTLVQIWRVLPDASLMHVPKGHYKRILLQTPSTAAILLVVNARESHLT